MFSLEEYEQTFGKVLMKEVILLLQGALLDFCWETESPTKKYTFFLEPKIVEILPTLVLFFPPSFWGCFYSPFVCRRHPCSLIYSDCLTPGDSISSDQCVHFWLELLHITWTYLHSTKWSLTVDFISQVMKSYLWLIKGKGLIYDMQSSLVGTQHFVHSDVFIQCWTSWMSEYLLFQVPWIVNII